MKKLFLILAVCGFVAFSTSCKKEKDCTCKASATLNGENFELPAEYQGMFKDYDVTIDGKSDNQKKCSDLNLSQSFEVPDINGTEVTMQTVEAKLTCTEK